MLSIVLASTLCLTWADTGTSHADCLQPEGTSCLQGDVSFLQKQIALQTDAADDLPVLTLLGRSFYSKDPSASAAFMQRYFNADAVDNPSGMVAMPGALTAGAFLKSQTQAGDYTLFFARAAESDTKLDEFVDTCELEFNDLTSPSKKNWSHWGDMHDGIADYVFNLHNAAADGMKFFHHGTVTRSMLAGTTYTFEMKMMIFDASDMLGAEAIASMSVDEALEDTCGFEIQSASDRGYLASHSWDLDEPCRASQEEEMKHANDEGANNHLWWKSTFAVANANAANKFATNVLGATYEYCPFPYPPNASCTGALWVNAAKEGDVSFQLHFVEFYEGSEHDEIVAVHAYHAEQAKALNQGCMMQAMYNNVAFNVATLDPFVDRLQKTSTPFLAMKTSNGRYALLFAFTGNEAVVIQLQSDVLTKADALDTGAISQACASMQH